MLDRNAALGRMHRTELLRGSDGVGTCVLLEEEKTRREGGFVAVTVDECSTEKLRAGNSERRHSEGSAEVEMRWRWHNGEKESTIQWRCDGTTEKMSMHLGGCCKKRG
ncbi:hypothetical protein S245_057063 [Arachis hypogaea]|nr:uncharacterized protein DS421_16g557050 [Arachis hypogaea]